MRFLTLLFLTALPVFAQKNLRYSPSYFQSRPEQSNYIETSRYDDVLRFIEVTVPRNANRLKATYFGYSTEGKRLPLVIWSKADSSSPEDVKSLIKKTRVLVFGNIHAGEVDGKEAILELIRDASNGINGTWADSLAVLYVPIYNADGNERIRLQNRPLQNGPHGGMGQRPNAMDLDLNRDFMKIDAPETRSLLRLIQEYDPHVVIDLHTTNGSVHAYHLTYAPPLNPNTDQNIDGFLRNEFFPTVSQNITNKYGWNTYYYGNLPEAENPAPKAWYTFDHRPRFGTNYTGLRNRIGILSESYSYLSFEDRIKASKRFVEECLSVIYRNGAKIRELTANADNSFQIGSLQALKGEIAQTTAETQILLGEIAEETSPFSGETYWNRLDVVKPETMPTFQHFTPTQTEIVPFAYFIPATEKKAIERLKAHGIAVEILENETELLLESFTLEETKLAERAFQGHKARSIKGSWNKPKDQRIEKGTAMIRMNQPLARLAFSLLEPLSDDGLYYWNFFDANLEKSNQITLTRTHIGF